MQLVELERIFKKLESIGIRSIILFSKEGEIIKSTISSNESSLIVKTIIDVISDSNKVLKNLMDTKTNINQLKVVTDILEINVIIGKKYILAYKSDKPRLEVYNRYLEVARKIDELYK